MMDETRMIDFAEALAAGCGPLLERILAGLTALPGVMDATLLAVAPDRQSVERIASSNPARFPVGGGEALDREDPWCQRIMGEKQPVLANDSAGLRLYLTEAADIEAAGYGASGSFPIVIGGEVAGTVNVLAPSGYFTAQTVATVTTYLPLAALGCLLHGREVAARP